MILVAEPNITIKRWYHNDCTLGRLRAGSFQCWTLELPNLGNQQDISCIPEGDYEYYSRYSEHNGNCLQLKAVPNRTSIQIHAANYVNQILGCLAVGDSIKFMNNDLIPDVTNSVETLEKLRDNSAMEGVIRIESGKIHGDCRLARQ